MTKTHKTPMVSPNYTQGGPSEKIILEGETLIFGCGDLLHEKIFFELPSTNECVYYDPIEWELSAEITVESKITKVLNRQYKNILALFSLHYEPQWLTILKLLTDRLENNGNIYFAIDSGFRAKLDRNTTNANFEGDFGNSLDKLIAGALNQRLNPIVCSPWLPDVSASNYDLVLQILGLYGKVEKPLKSIDLKRNISNEEPRCYLPWNPEHIPSINNFVFELDVSTEVTETIDIVKWTKKTSLPELFDGNPQAKIIWTLVVCQATEKISKLIIPVASRDSVSKDDEVSYRNAVLQVLYFCLLRHFSCWRAIEVIIGALHPGDSVRNLTSGGYQCTALGKKDDPRFLYAEVNNTPEFLSAYLDQAKVKFGGWAGELLYTKKNEGVYFWGGENITDSEAPSNSITLETSLNKEFKKRDVPPCLYCIDALASDSLGKHKGSDQLFGALVIYLSSESYNKEEASILLDCLTLIRPILVGRSAFLELNDARKTYKLYTDILEPISTIEEAEKALSKVLNAVEIISARLVDGVLLPATTELEALKELYREYLFKPYHHVPNIKANNLLDMIRRQEVVNARKSLIQSLCSQEKYFKEDLVKRLFFFLFDEEYIKNNEKCAAAVTKHLLGHGKMPLCWLLHACDVTFENNDANLMSRAVKSIRNYNNILRAIVGCRMLRALPQSEQFKFDSESSMLSLIIVNDGHDISIIRNFIKDKNRLLTGNSGHTTIAIYNLGRAGLALDCEDIENHNIRLKLSIETESTTMSPNL